MVKNQKKAFNNKKKLITQFLSGIFGTEMQKSAGEASTSTMDAQVTTDSDHFLN